MPTVTVSGANGQTVSLNFDTNANAMLAQNLAAALTVGIQAGTILPATDTDGPPPPLPPGTTGAFIQTEDGLTVLPPGYDAVVDTASNAVIFGSGDAGETVLIGSGGGTFIATGVFGSGTVVAGGSDSRIIVPTSVTGSWSFNTGNGDDTVLAAGTGNDTINAGGGHNAIMLGSGSYIIQSTGDDTVDAGSGYATIAALGPHKTLVFGNSSQLLFVASDGAATVFGGNGSDTFFGGKGPDLVYGGTGGNNLLFAGTGKATLFGSGDGDQLIAAGHKAQALHAGAGNETLFGGLASGADTFYGGAGNAEITGGTGHDTFVAGTGAATVNAGLGSNLFVFTDGQAGGTELIKGFASGQRQIDLLGYGRNEMTNALKTQQNVAGSTTITLSDHTTITFAGIGNLTSTDFVAGSSGGGNGHHKFDGDEHVPSIRSPLIGHS